MSRLVAATFTTCLHSTFWVRISGIPFTVLPALSAGQLSEVSTRVGSFWVPSFASCWHVAQFLVKVSPMLVFWRRRGFMPNSEPLVADLILLSMLDGKSGVRAGAGLLGSRFLACRPFKPT